VREHEEQIVFEEVALGNRLSTEQRFEGRAREPNERFNDHRCSVGHGIDSIDVDVSMYPADRDDRCPNVSALADVEWSIEIFRQAGCDSVWDDCARPERGSPQRVTLA